MKRLILCATIVALLCGLLITEPASAEVKNRRAFDHIGAFVCPGGQPERVVIVPASAGVKSPSLKIVSGVVDTGDGKQVFFLFPDEPRFRPPGEVDLPLTTCSVSFETRAGYEFLRVWADASADEVERLLEEAGWYTGRAVGSANYW